MAIERERHKRRLEKQVEEDLKAARQPEPNSFRVSFVNRFWVWVKNAVWEEIFMVMSVGTQFKVMTATNHPFPDVDRWINKLIAAEATERDFRDVLNQLVRAADDPSDDKWGKIAVAIGSVREVLEKHPKES